MREMTTNDRRLHPDLVLIGATKCATSWLHLALQDHPEIAMVSHETYWLSLRYHMGMDCMSYFDAHYAADKLWGDYSNDYLTSAEPVVGNLLRQNPEARLIVSLRNPVERAYSFYKMFYRAGKYGNDPAAHLRPGERAYDEGFYFRNLTPFLEAFGRERLHLVLQDDIAADPEGVLRGLYDFLGVAPDHRFAAAGQTYNRAPDHRPKNVQLHRWLAWRLDKLGRGSQLGARLKQAVRRSPLKALYHRMNKGGEVPAFPADFRRQLATDYADDVRQLSHFLGRDLHAAWIEPLLRP